MTWRGLAAATRRLARELGRAIDAVRAGRVVLDIGAWLGAVEDVVGRDMDQGERRRRAAAAATRPAPVAIDGEGGVGARLRPCRRRYRRPRLIDHVGLRARRWLRAMRLGRGEIDIRVAPSTDHVDARRRQRARKAGRDLPLAADHDDAQSARAHARSPRTQARAARRHRPCRAAAATRPRCRDTSARSSRCRSRRSPAARQPSSRLDLGGIDGIAPIVAGPVGDEGDQRPARRPAPAAARSRMSQMRCTTSRLCARCAAADVVGLADPAALDRQRQRARRDRRHRASRAHAGRRRRPAAACPRAR